MGMIERNNVSEKLFYFSDLKVPAIEQSQKGPGTLFGVREKVINGNYVGDIIFSYKPFLPPKNFERENLFFVEFLRPNLPTLNDFIDILEETEYTNRIVAYFNKLGHIKSNGNSDKFPPLEFIHWKSGNYERVGEIDELEPLENRRIVPLDSIEVNRKNLSGLESDLKLLESEINDVYGLL